MSQTINDSKLNKAALIIARLLILTREGKIQWTSRAPTLLSGDERFSTKLEDKIEAAVSRSGTSLGFTLSGPPALKIQSSGLLLTFKDNEILSISLSDKDGEGKQRTPEGIISKDLLDLFQLASNPKSVSDDLRLKQVIDYLDKLAD